MATDSDEFEQFDEGDEVIIRNDPNEVVGRIVARQGGAMVYVSWPGRPTALVNTCLLDKAPKAEAGPTEKSNT